jgi:hypothetical protein
MRERQPRTLQQAGAVVFVLIGLLPLLIFAWTLWTVGAIHTLYGQVGLGLALAIALLGFHIYRGMMTRISAFMRAMSKAAQQRTPTAAAGQVPDRHATGKQALTAVHTPGIGPIREFNEMAQTMSSLWKREAAPLVGKPVIVSVVNSTMPVEGTLLTITDDGLLLERGGESFGVVYRRIAGVEPVSPPDLT